VLKHRLAWHHLCARYNTLTAKPGGRNNLSGFYFGGIWFESQSQNRLSLFRLLSHFLYPPGKCHSSTFIRYSRHTVHRCALFRHNGFGIHTGRILQHARKFTLHYSGRRHADANVFWRFENLLRQSRIVIPTAPVNTGHPWILRTPVNEDAIMAAVGRTWWRWSRVFARELRI